MITNASNTANTKNRLCLHDTYPPEKLDDYDAVEIRGVQQHEGHCEVNDLDPHFFSVYLHVKEGGVNCVGDFGQFAWANRYAEAFGLPVHNYVALEFVNGASA